MSTSLERVRLSLQHLIARVHLAMLHRGMIPLKDVQNRTVGQPVKPHRIMRSICGKPLANPASVPEVTRHAVRRANLGSRVTLALEQSPQRRTWRNEPF